MLSEQILQTLFITSHGRWKLQINLNNLEAVRFSKFWDFLNFVFGQSSPISRLLRNAIDFSFSHLIISLPFKYLAPSNIKMELSPWVMKKLWTRIHTRSFFWIVIIANFYFYISYDKKLSLGRQPILLARFHFWEMPQTSCLRIR